MENFRSIFKSSLNPAEGRSASYYDRITSVVDESQIFQNKDVTELTNVCSQINQSLGQNKTRLQSLTQLYKVLQQCNSQVLQQNAMTWAKLLLTILQSRDSEDMRGLAACIMGVLISHMTSFPEVSREFGSALLPSLITALLGADLKWKSSALRTLCVCMKSFRGSCAAMKNKIEVEAQKMMDVSDETVRKRAMEVYALLAGVGGAGVKGTRHEQSWTQNMDRLVSSLHDTLDKAYATCETDEHYERGEFGVKYWEDDVTGLEKYLTLAQRFNTLVYGIRAMLKHEVSTAVHVPLKSLIHVLQRVLAVSPAIAMMKPTAERTYLTSILPSLYTDALSLMTSLLYCVTGHVIPYVTLVNKLLLQLLTSTQNTGTAYGATKPYSGVREAVYKFMCHLMQVLGANCGLETHADQLLPCLIPDISPQQDTLKLNEGSRLSDISEQMSQRGKKKGGKRNVGASNIGEISSQRKINMAANASLCSEALEVLRLLLATVGPLMNAKHYTTLHNLLLPLTATIQQRNYCSVPYSSDAGCRAALYRVLEALVVHHHHKIAPPAVCVHVLLTGGTKDRSAQVREVCKQALISMEILNHPRAPTLYFPLPVKDQQHQQQEKPRAENNMNNVWLDSNIDRLGAPNTNNTESSISLNKFANNVVSAVGNINKTLSKNLTENIGAAQATEVASKSNVIAPSSVDRICQSEESLRQDGVNSDNFIIDSDSSSNDVEILSSSYESTGKKRKLEETAKEDVSMDKKICQENNADLTPTTEVVEITEKETTTIILESDASEIQITESHAVETVKVKGSRDTDMTSRDVDTTPDSSDEGVQAMLADFVAVQSDDDSI